MRRKGEEVKGRWKISRGRGIENMRDRKEDLNR